VTFAEQQREAVECALRARDGRGYVHVYGAKLYGPLEPGEFQCTSAHPFDGSQRGPVVFHSELRLLGWGGCGWDHFCFGCGLHPMPAGSRSA
jgi:hypothetical protein